MQDAPGQTSLDHTKVQTFMQRRRAEQSMPLALAAGVVSALVGAAIWAIVTDMTKGFQIGWKHVNMTDWPVIIHWRSRRILAGFVFLRRD